MAYFILAIVIGSIFLCIFSDIYIYYRYRYFFSRYPVLRVIFFSFNLIALLSTFAILGKDWLNQRGLSLYFNLGMVVILTIYLPKLLWLPFVIFSDTINFVRQMIGRKMLRIIAGAFIPVSVFLLLIYGFFIEPYTYKVRKVDVYLPYLPPQLNGFRIVHISDFHAGSYWIFKDRIAEELKKINTLYPDIICFTGDIVNNYSSELEGWVAPFQSLQARYGKFAILGNHDYGDYAIWDKAEEKIKNAAEIEIFFEKTDFFFLKNQSHVLRIDDVPILGIIGVENWGYGRFSKYGNLNHAMQDLPEGDFPKLLLTHDPTHWTHQVVHKKDIRLTLAGHTHGSQAGFWWGDKRYSLASLFQKHWGGLFHEGGQSLYVNTGLGMIGFPFRIGMRPEITLITLRKQ